MEVRAFHLETSMGKKDTVGQLADVGGFLADLGDQMIQLSGAIRDDDDDLSNQLVKALPSSKEITKQLTTLGKILEREPWKKGKRNAG